MKFYNFKENILFCLLFVLSLFINYQAIGQTAPNKYLINFTDKIDSPFSTDNPLEFLSERAVQRRLKNKIAISENDLPVNLRYIDSLRNMGIQILTTSKWMNDASIFCTDTALLDSIMDISFIKSVKKSSYVKIDTNLFSSKKKANISNQYNSNYYGLGWWQIKMLYGDYLHTEGFKGENMLISVIDAGFYNADTLPAFDSAWHNNQIIGYKDFVSQPQRIFTSSFHGMKVLSTMVGNVPGTFVGTAPKANYLLLRSEDASSEYIIEEDNWIAAAEFADSVGADIISSSLGYNNFNDTISSHLYEDLDGNTTRISIAADIAASKGILVVTSAGNEGGKPWKYITAPADADSILTVGAVDSSSNYAYFSSLGPSYDGRIKPDVAALGQDAYFQWVSEAFGPGNGTSFSAPIIAGLAACLWQANPDASNMEIIDAIKQSSSQYYLPDNKLGYGVPNFKIADSILKNHIVLKNDSISVFPNPFKQTLYIEMYNSKNEEVQIEIYNSIGRQVYSSIKSLGNGYVNYIILNDVLNLKSGLYIIKLIFNNNSQQLKIIKE